MGKSVPVIAQIVQRYRPGSESAWSLIASASFAVASDTAAQGVTCWRLSFHGCDKFLKQTCRFDAGRDFQRAVDIEDVGARRGGRRNVGGAPSPSAASPPLTVRHRGGAGRRVPRGCPSFHCLQHCGELRHGASGIDRFSRQRERLAVGGSLVADEDGRRSVLNRGRAAGAAFLAL